jgi:hypothetical protein
MKPVFKMKGVGELLEVYEASLTITPKGLIGLASKGLKGMKTIPFTSITAIQFKKSGPHALHLEVQCTLYRKPKRC